MGLIKAAQGAVGGVLADQWREFFYCDALDKNTLMKKGKKRTGARSTNLYGSNDIISNGSVIAVADGQCMLIVEQGRVVEVCAEPGEFVYNSSTEPSIFAGKFGQSLIDSFKTLGRRFSFGGDTGKDQRVYFVNTKEIMDNKFGTPTPVLFRIVDSKIGLDMETEIKCNGVYSYKISDPIVFYTNICANVENEFKRSEIDIQLKTEFMDALSPAVASLAEYELRPNQIPAHTRELREKINEDLRDSWLEMRGITIAKIAMNPISMNDEDKEYLKQYQRAATVDNRPGLGAAMLLEKSGDALKGAANNENGAVNGFVGMGMAMNGAGGIAGGMGSLFGAMGQHKDPTPEPPQTPQRSDPEDKWVCATCGTKTHGKFCPECGSARPPEAKGWTCPKCGNTNKGKFCLECGTKKPVNAPLYRCDKCGWEPEDPYNPPKFCQECGDPFTDTDIV